MGANDREANATESLKDFIAKYVIVKKETNETIFWLEVIRDINIGQKIHVDADKLITEGKEIYNIVRSIIFNTKKNH